MGTKCRRLYERDRLGSSRRVAVRILYGVRTRIAPTDRRVLSNWSDLAARWRLHGVAVPIRHLSETRAVRVTGVRYPLSRFIVFYPKNALHLEWTHPCRGDVPQRVLRKWAGPGLRILPGKRLQELRFGRRQLRILSVHKRGRGLQRRGHDVAAPHGGGGVGCGREISRGGHRRGVVHPGAAVRGVLLLLLRL